MKFFVLLFASLSFLYSSNLVTYNIYERNDRIDIILSFDTPYEGAISQQNSTSFITLTLNGARYDRLIEKSINSPLIQELLISPEGKNLKVTLKSDKHISVVASKTVDGFGLRIRGTYQANGRQNQSANASSDERLGDTASSSSSWGRFFGVGFVILLIGLFVFWIRRTLNSDSLLKNNLAYGSEETWLVHTEESQPISHSSLVDEVNILYKKPLDSDNSVVLFEYNHGKYLVLTGNTNVLLERFYDGEIKNKSDFEKIIEENKTSLNTYLQVGNTKLDNYKNKASADYQPPLES